YTTLFRSQDIELAHQLAVQTKAVEVDIVADLQIEIDEHWNARDHRGLGTLIINDHDILRHPRRTRRQGFDVGTGVRNPRDAFDANGFAVRGKVNGRADIGIDLLLLQYLKIVTGHIAAHQPVIAAQIIQIARDRQSTGA